MKLRVIAIIPIVVLLLLGMTGCERLAKKAVEDATGIKVEEDGSRVTMTGEDGTEFEFEGGDTSTLPDAFPSDFPVYDDARIEGSTSMRSGDETNLTVTLISGDSYSEVYEWYMAELTSAGWDIESEYDFASDGSRHGQIHAREGDREAVLLVNQDDNDTVTIHTQLMLR